jgi:hypothetical protein
VRGLIVVIGGLPVGRFGWVAAGALMIMPSFGWGLGWVLGVHWGIHAKTFCNQLFLFIWV